MLHKTQSSLMKLLRHFILLIDFEEIDQLTKSSFLTGSYKCSDTNEVQRVSGSFCHLIHPAHLSLRGLRPWSTWSRTRQNKFLLKPPQCSNFCCVTSCLFTYNIPKQKHWCKITTRISTRRNDVRWMFAETKKSTITPLMSISVGK